MEENMKLLIDLQSCDTEIGNLERRIAEVPLRIKEIEGRLAEMDDEWKAAEKQLADLKLKRREVEKDIEMAESQIGKANTKLSNIKSNKEYKAALKEIDDLSREKSKLEDKAIEFMEQVDSLAAQCLTKKEESDRFRQEVTEERENILQEMGSMDKTLKILGMKRGQFCTKVSGELLKRYDLIRERKSGVALSPVLNGVCQVCHMEIPPQKYNELLRGERFLDCPYCHRIIYSGDSERFQKAGKEE